MDKKEKRAFTAAAVCSILLILSTLMGLAGTISSSGGFSFFAAVSILNFLTLLYLTVVLFRKKKDRHLGLALGANALVSLLTVCFFFSWQELFICLTLAILTLNYFMKDGGNRKGFQLAALLSAAGILISTVAVFTCNFRRAGNETVWDPGRWMYYFVPFLFALLYAALADLAALVINDSPVLKKGCRQSRLGLLPALLLILAALLSAVSAATGSAGVLLILSAVAAYGATAVFPFLFLFLKPGTQC